MGTADRQPKPKARARANGPALKAVEPSSAAVADSKTSACRILVAEDSPVTQDLLKLLLEQRGHIVDLAPDGEKALAALEAQRYDVVLMDFQLPKMDGLEVATRYRKNVPQNSGPRLVAITSDIKGLLSHAGSCENFDEVISKPFDLKDILEVVERRREDDQTLDAIPVQPMPAADSAGMAGPQERKYEFLRWPEDFNSDRLSARGMQASLADGRFDAIMLNEPVTVRDLSVIWTTKTLHLLPVIDMTGCLPNQADLDASKLNVEETGKLDRLIQSFQKRRAQLHSDLAYTDDIGEKIIGRMFVSGGSLELAYDAASKEYVSYNAILDFHSIEKEVKDLLAKGLLARTFFDRLHICDRCGSSHLNIREECANCGSTNLNEEAYLHHFKCAYQGPESDFHQDDDLVCPKCRKVLSHFSVDYDKPGSMMRCQSCGHATSEPRVGFVCMACQAHYDGDTIRTRDVFSYELTGRGNDFAAAGRVLLDGDNASLRFSELPLELIISMNAELRKYDADQTPFALLNISYRNAQEIENRDGLRLFMQARDLFLENLRNTVRKDDRIVKGRNYDFALLKGASPDETRSEIDGLRKETTETLSVDLGVHIDVFGPRDFK